MRNKKLPGDFRRLTADRFLAAMDYLKLITSISLILAVISILYLQAQEDDYKDAPYFPGMPNYVIDFVKDIELVSSSGASFNINSQELADL